MGDVAKSRFRLIFEKRGNPRIPLSAGEDASLSWALVPLSALKRLKALSGDQQVIWLLVTCGCSFGLKYRKDSCTGVCVTQIA